MPRKSSKMAEAAEKVGKAVKKIAKKSKEVVEEVKAAVEYTLDQAVAAFKRASESASLITSSFYTLGESLSLIRNSGFYTHKKLGEHKSFQAFVEVGVGLDLSVASKAVKIYEFYSGIGADPKKVVKLGVSKALAMTQVVTADNFDEWVKKAEGTTVEQLAADIVRKKTKTKGGAKVKVATFSFRAVDEQIANIEFALSEAADMTNSKERGVQLDLICTEWLQSHLPTNESLDRWVELIERVYKVKVVIEGRPPVNGEDKTEAAPKASKKSKAKKAVASEPTQEQMEQMQAEL